MRRVLCIALTALFASWTPFAASHADPTARDEEAARAHFEQAERLFAAGRFAEALAEYQAAYQAAPFPELLFDIGQAQRNLHHVDEAIFAFKEYLRRRPAAENRVQVERLLDELEREKARRDAEAKARLSLVPKPGEELGPRSIYKRWWFWTGIGAVATTAIVLILLPHDKNIPDTPLGNVDFPK